MAKKKEKSQVPITKKNIIFLGGDDYMIYSFIRNERNKYKSRKWIQLSKNKSELIDECCNSGIGDEDTQKILEECPNAEITTDIINLYKSIRYLYVMGTPRKNSNAYKLAEECCFLEEKVAPTEIDKVRWILGTINGHGKSISYPYAEYLCRRCNGNMFKIENEINKLICYVNNNTNIGISDINELVPSEDNFIIWNLCDAFSLYSSTDKTKCIEEVLKQISIMKAVGNDSLPIQAMSTLIWYFNSLAALSTEIHKGVTGDLAIENVIKNIVKEDGKSMFNSYGLKKSYNIAKNRTPMEFAFILNELNCAEIDVRLARGIEKFGVMEKLVLSICYREAFNNDKTRVYSGKSIRWNKF